MADEQSLFPDPLPTLTAEQVEMIAEGPERIWRAWDFADNGTPVTSA